MRRKPVNLVKQRNGKNIDLEKYIPTSFFVFKSEAEAGAKEANTNAETEAQAAKKIDEEETEAVTIT